jgi:predicted regulator of Ras-like GTPase activity (Roadblock/LC7/MglB family)
MNDSKYMNLLQEQFDIDLSLPQKYALQGYLDGNAQALQLSQQIQSVLERSDDLTVPQECLPRNPDGLHSAIMERLETQKSELPPVLKWIVLLFKKEPRCKTDSAGLERLKKRSTITSGPTSEESILAKARTKSPAPLEPQHDSLAQLIKKRLDLSRTFTTDDTDDRPTTPHTVTAPYVGAAGETTGDALNMEAWPIGPAWPETASWPIQPPQLEAQFSYVQPGSFEYGQPAQPEMPSGYVQPQEPDGRFAEPPMRADMGNAVPQEPGEHDQPMDVPLHAADPSAENFYVDFKVPYTVPPMAAVPQQENLARVIPVDAISSAIDALFVDAPRVPPIELPPDRVTHLQVEPADEIQIQQDEIDRQRSTFARLNISEQPAGSGQITSLGKFLLDPHCERMIGSMISGSNRKLTTRVLTEQESADLKECLKPIGDQDGVAGCVVLGYDGFVIANTLPAGCDLDVFSAWALVTYISSNNAVDFIGQGRVHQIVSRTLGGIILLADFGQGLLVAVSDKTSSEAVLTLMRGARKISAA